MFALGYSGRKQWLETNGKWCSGWAWNISKLFFMNQLWFNSIIEHQKSLFWNAANIHCFRIQLAKWFETKKMYDQAAALNILGFSINPFMELGFLWYPRSETSNVFVRGPHKLLRKEFEGLTSYVMWLFRNMLHCTVLRNQQIFGKQNIFLILRKGFAGRMKWLGGLGLAHGP